MAQINIKSFKVQILQISNRPNPNIKSSKSDLNDLTFSKLKTLIDLNSHIIFLNQITKIEKYEKQNK